MEHDIIISDSSGEVYNSKGLTGIAKFISSPSGRQKLASAMIAPIRRSLDYQGIARRALVIDPLPQGALSTYDKDIDVCSFICDKSNNKTSLSELADILDSKSCFRHDVIISDSSGEIYNSSNGGFFKGRRIKFPTFEIVSNPTIKLSDIKTRRFSLIDRAVQKAKSEIMAQEDDNVFKALDDINGRYNK